MWRHHVRAIAKSAALTVPYVRRVHDGLTTMRSHIAVLEAEIARLKQVTAPTTLAYQETQEHGVKLIYWLDHVWCDASGLFVQGWVHMGPHSILSLSLECGDAKAELANFTSRLDIRSHYPELPDTGAAGFVMYLACSPLMPVTMTARTEKGTCSALLTISTTPNNPEVEATPTVNAFTAAMGACQGRVLEVGARVVGSMTQGWRDHFPPGCT